MVHFIERIMKKTTLIITLIILIASWGSYAILNMNKNYLPQINNPTVMVSVYAPHYQSGRVQKQITPKVTRALKNVKNIESIQTQAYDNGLFVSLTFPLHKDIDQAQKDIQTSLSDLSLPQGANAPLVTKISSDAFSMMKIALSSESLSSNELRTDEKEKIKNELERIPGVKEIHVTGGADNGFVIRLLPDKLSQFHVSLEDVKASLQSLDVAWPNGQVSVSLERLPVKVTSSEATEEQIENIQVGKDHQVLLKNIASVEKGIVNAQRLSRTDGKTSVFLDVMKTESADITKLSKQVEKTLNQIPEIKSNTVKAAILQNQGSMIDHSINGLLREGLLGTIFSILSVLFFFRNSRSTLLVSLSVPISMLMTMICLHQWDVSLNLLTVSGMIVAMGRVVDDSIVVMDNIHRKIERTKGDVTAKHIAEAVAEMVPAISSSTLTTILVYVPIALIGGMMGAAFSGFSLTVTLALLTSLVVSIFVIPALFWLFRGFKQTRPAFKIEPAVSKLLDFCLKKKAAIGTIAILILILSIAVAFFIPVQVMPRSHAQDINIQIESRENATLDQVNGEVKSFETMLRSNKNIKTYSSSVGATFTPVFDDIFDQGGGWIQRNNIANIFVTPKSNVSNEKVAAEIKDGIKGLSPNVKYTVSSQQIAGDDSRVNLVLSGGDQKELSQAAITLQSKLQMIKGLSILGNEASSDQLNFTVNLDQEKLQQYGIDQKQVFNKIDPFYSVDNLMNVTINEHPTDIELIRESKERAQLTGGNQDPVKQMLIKIGDIGFKTDQGKTVHLNQFATLEATPSMVISEKDGEPIAIISGNIITKDIGGVNKQINKVLKATDFPDGITYSMNGITKQVKDLVVEMTLSILISIVLIVMVIKSVFKGFRPPLAVLSALPFTFTGSIIGLLLFRNSWDLGALVGLVMLTGVIATNGIVLVDKIERNLAMGLAVNEAIFKGSINRVRPVLMTALTTVLTLLPLVFLHQDQSLISKSLGIVVVGGMISGTVSSLVLIPILYQFMHSIRAKRWVDQVTSRKIG